MGVAQAVKKYLAAGWHPLPLPAGEKSPPPSGFTGRGGAWPSGADVHAWLDEGAYGNVALRLPRDVVGLDIDQPDKLPELEAEVGCPLPGTWSVTARGADSAQRTLLYRVPSDVDLAERQFAPGELITWRHRYMVVAPSIHPDTGTEYVMYAPDGQGGRVARTERACRPASPVAGRSDCRRRAS